MKNRLFFLSAVVVLLSCNNSTETPSTNSLTKPSADSGVNAPLQNQLPDNGTDSVASSDIASLEKAFDQRPSQENAIELAFAYAEEKNKKTLALTDTLVKYGNTEGVGKAWYIKGLYYQNAGDAQKALRFYGSSITTDYTFLDSYRDKGQLQYALKQYDGALKTFAQGQSLSHDLSAKAEFIYWAAKTFEALGDKRNAKDNYERAYAMDKTLTEAKQAAEKIGL